MSDEPKRERIPLPPILLTVAPILSVPLAAVLALVLYRPFGRVGAFAGMAVALIVPILWLAKRVRGRDAP